MKIKNLFFILMIGICVIPLLSVGIMTLMIYYRSVSRFLVQNVATGDADVRAADGSEIPEELEYSIRLYVDQLPHYVECAAVNAGGLVLYSDIPGIRENSYLSQEEAKAFVRSAHGQYFFGLDTNLEEFKRKNSGENYTAADLPEEDLVFFLTRIEKEKTRHPPPFLRDFIFVLVAISETILLFAVVISVCIIRSITVSVENLKDAAETLESGNFDREIKLKSNNEIMVVAESMDRMRLQLKDDRIRRSRFLMGLSHDLRTPVALIKGYTEAIRDGYTDDPEMLEKSLDIIDSKTGQLESLLNSLIESIRIETSEWKGNLSECRLKPFLETFASRVCQDGALLNRHVVVSVEMPDNLELQADETIFTRFLDNLLGNAFRYTADGGVIRFSAIWHSAAQKKRRAKNVPREKEQRGPGVLEICIADDGCGIAEKDLPFVFDAFYRGTNSRREEGHGFGLSIVKHIADAYGWDLSVESREGKGTVFTVVIYDCLCGA